MPFTVLLTISSFFPLSPGVSARVSPLTGSRQARPDGSLSAAATHATPSGRACFFFENVDGVRRRSLVRLGLELLAQDDAESRGDLTAGGRAVVGLMPDAVQNEPVQQGTSPFYE